MDFESIGKAKDENTKLKPAFENTYLLRSSLLENIDEQDKDRLYKIGRACYHLVQRRGFKTSRKSGKSGYAKNEELEKIKEENPSIQISQVLQSKLKAENKRIRGSQRVILRENILKMNFMPSVKNKNLSRRINR